MIRRISMFLSLFVIVSSFAVYSQNAVITFTEKKHNFGEIDERGGRAVHSFEFKNTGNSPLIIQRVTASCGCTSPDWTKTPVEPGATGYIEVSYNPIGRPGAFTKSISVFSNASNEREILYISGTVSRQQVAENRPVENTSASEKIGNLKLSSRTINLGKVDKNGTQQSQVLSVQNLSNKAVTINFAQTPSHIVATMNPKTLQPGARGNLTVSFDPKKINEWGPVENVIYILENNSKERSDQSSIKLSASLIEDFSNLSISEKQQAPILQVKSYNLDLGSIKKGNRVRGQFSIKNVGKNTLEIRKIVNNNSDIIITPVRTSIHGGRSDKFRIEIDSRYTPIGNQKKTFTIYSNDPQKSITNFNISYRVY